MRRAFFANALEETGMLAMHVDSRWLGRAVAHRSAQEFPVVLLVESREVGEEINRRDALAAQILHRHVEEPPRETRSQKYLTGMNCNDETWLPSEVPDRFPAAPRSGRIRAMTNEPLSFDEFRVGWALTLAGEELLPVFHALMVWGARHERT